MKKENKRNQGITLVALIITIIILIILAAVTINLLMNTKFIETAIGGTQNYQEAQYKEADDINKLNGKLEKAIKDIEDASNGEQPEEGVPDGYIRPRGTITITENGNYDIVEYAEAEVNVPIPEEFVKPEGTKKITTKSNKIDIKNYEYVDTTSLYTANESQFGEGICWKSGTANCDSSGKIEVSNIGFKPSKVFLYGTFTKNSKTFSTMLIGTPNKTSIWIKNIDGTTRLLEDWTNGFEITNTGFKIFPFSGEFINQTYDWTAIK